MLKGTVFPKTLVAVAVLVVWGGFTIEIEAQSPPSYSIQQVIVDGQTPRPDGLGNFSVLGGISNIPVIDGDWIVFRSATPGCMTSPTDTCVELWSVNFTNSSFVKLVDHNTPVPHGTGNFQVQGVSCFFPQARGGWVIFQAQDQTNPTGVTGLYTVPTAGGKVHLVAKAGMNAPDGGTFTTFGSGCGATTTGWDIYGDNAVFLAQTTRGGSFVYSWEAKSGLAVVQDQPVQGLLGCFADPEVSREGNVVFFGVDCFDSPFRGGYFLAPTDSTIVYTGSQFQVAEWYGPSELSGSQLSTLFNSPGYEAIGVTSTLTGGISGPNGSYSPQFKLWDSNTPMPGISTLPVFVAGGTFSSDRGSAAFQAFQNQGASQNPGLYIVSGGTPQLVIAAGDTLGGSPIYGFGQTEHGQLEMGKLVFTTVGLNVLVNLASPAMCTSDVSPQVSIHKSGYSLNPATQQYVQHLNIVNTSSATISGPMILAVTHISSDAILANQSGYTACVAPLGSPYVTLNVGSGGLPPSASVRVELDFSDPSSQAITHGLALLAGAGIP